MLNTFTKCLAVLAVSASFLGCDQEGRVTQQGVGQVAGGVLGGVLGAQIKGSGRTAAIIGGAVLGGHLGGMVGRSMDQVDRIRLANSLENASVNQSVHWSDPYDKEVTVIPVSDYRYRGMPCRRFRVVILSHGREQIAYGRACRYPDGVWRIIN